MANYNLSQGCESMNSDLEDFLINNQLQIDPYGNQINLVPEYVSLDQICPQPMSHLPLLQEQPCPNNEQPVNTINEPLTPTGRSPSSDEYPGPYDFEVLLAGSTSSKKSWVYSHVLNKVFLDMDKVLAVEFKINSAVSGLRIRALAVYNTEDIRHIAVKRCTVHSVQVDPQCLAHKDKNICLCSNFKWVGHVIQTTHEAAIYEYDITSGRHSVTVPMEPVQPGCDKITVPYLFTCKTSCMSGMNRNPIDVIFTLETPMGEVVGRSNVGVKICSCPKRDKSREEHADKITKEDCIRLGVDPPLPQGKCKRSSAVKTEITNKKIKVEKLSPLPVDQINGPQQVQTFFEEFKQLSKKVKELEEKIPEILKCLEKPN